MLKTRLKIAGLALAALTLLTFTAFADNGFGEEDPFAPPELKVDVKALAEPLVAGETVEFAVIYHVPEGTHLTDYFRTVLIKSNPPLEFGEAIWPEGIHEGEESIWRGDVEVRSRVTLPDAAGTLKLNVEAEYQICQEGEVEMCFPPTAALAEAEYAILTEGTAFEQKATATKKDEKIEAPAGKGLAGKFEAALNQGSWIIFLLVFLGGILASLTPCVLPIIPVTISFLTVNAKGSPLKGFVLSLWYVLGIAIVYSSLGLAAAAGGSAFGSVTQTPIFLGIISAVIFAMSLSMAGLFDIQVPSALTSKVGGGKTGFLGPLFMGMAMGMIAAPCVGPILIVLLTWVATTGSMFLGFWLLFTFSIGMGMLFIALGTFGGMIPPGPWMETVKHAFALILFPLALSFLDAFVPGWILTMVLGLSFVFALSAWGALKPLSEDAGARESMGKGLGRLLWILGVVLAILGGLKGFAPGLLPSSSPTGVTTVTTLLEPEWIRDKEAGFAEAATDGKPVMMDFWAEWCVACNELDHFTYSQTEVLALAEEFVPIKMDMTKNSDANKSILNKYEVFGMPTVIFFDSSGQELERFSGFISAEDMLPYMQRALATK